MTKPNYIHKRERWNLHMNYTTYHGKWWYRCRYELILNAVVITLFVWGIFFRA